jgi:hypothetical protein
VAEENKEVAATMVAKAVVATTTVVTAAMAVETATTEEAVVAATAHAARPVASVSTMATGVDHRGGRQGNTLATSHDVNDHRPWYMDSGATDHCRAFRH